jgi:hypothetical protein
MLDTDSASQKFYRCKQPLPVLGSEIWDHHCKADDELYLFGIKLMSYQCSIVRFTPSQFLRTMWVHRSNQNSKLHSPVTSPNNQNFGQFISQHQHSFGPSPKDRSIIYHDLKLVHCPWARRCWHTWKEWAWDAPSSLLFHLPFGSIPNCLLRRIQRFYSTTPLTMSVSLK